MHTHFTKNKRLLLIYKDGTKEIAKFWKTEGKFIFFIDHKEIRLDKLRAICIYKPQSNQREDKRNGK